MRNVNGKKKKKRAKINKKGLDFEMNTLQQIIYTNKPSKWEHTQQK